MCCPQGYSPRDLAAPDSAFLWRRRPSPRAAGTGSPSRQWCAGGAPRIPPRPLRFSPGEQSSVPCVPLCSRSRRHAPASPPEKMYYNYCKLKSMKEEEAKKNSAKARGSDPHGQELARALVTLIWAVRMRVLKRLSSLRRRWRPAPRRLPRQGRSFGSCGQTRLLRASRRPTAPRRSLPVVAAAATLLWSGQTLCLRASGEDVRDRDSPPRLLLL